MFGLAESIAIVLGCTLGGCSMWELLQWYRRWHIDTGAQIQWYRRHLAYNTLPNPYQPARIFSKTHPRIYSKSMLEQSPTRTPRSIFLKRFTEEVTKSRSPDAHCLECHGEFVDTTSNERVGNFHKSCYRSLPTKKHYFKTLPEPNQPPQTSYNEGCWCGRLHTHDSEIRPGPYHTPGCDYYSSPLPEPNQPPQVPPHDPDNTRDSY